MNQTLEEMARTLFKSWFVDFDPVRAKAALKQHAVGHYAGRALEPSGDDATPTDDWTVERARTYLAGLDPEFFDLFPDRLVDSELGEIPAGWQILPISSLAAIRGGKQLPKERLSGDGTIPVFGGAGIMGHTDSFNAEGYIISVGRVGAYCGQFFVHRGKAWINNNASLISPHYGLSGEWLVLALRNLDLDAIKRGAAQPFVSNSDLAAMKVVDPGDQAKTAFQSAISGHVQRVESNHLESANLSSVRDTLIPNLLAGHYRVSKGMDN